MVCAVAAIGYLGLGMPIDQWNELEDINAKDRAHPDVLKVRACGRAALMPTLKGVKATPWHKILASPAAILVVCLSFSMFRYEMVEKPSSGPCGVRGEWRVLDRWTGKVTTYPRADFEQTQGVLNRWSGRVDKAAGAR